MEKLNLVVPKTGLPTELQYRDNLIAGLSRVAAKIGRGNLADKSGRTTRALDKLFSGATEDTSGYGLIAFLNADPSALDEVLKLIGLGVHRLPEEHSADDHSVIADATALVAEHTEAMRDGKRDHRDTLRIADKARPVIASYTSIIRDADKIRGLQ